MGSISKMSHCPLSHDVLLIHLPTEPKLEWSEALMARYPGFRVRWVAAEHRSDSDVFRPGYLELPEEIYEGVTMVMSVIPPPPDAMKRVRFVQVTSAGADRWVTHDKYKDKSVSFCTANGIHATQIAEWVIGSWLMAQHHFQRAFGFMAQGRWAKSDDFNPTEDSPGLRMGILGYGAIGRQCARLASAMGMEIYAYTRTERSTLESRRDDSFYIPGTGDPEGLIPSRWFHGSSTEDVNHFLSQDLDILVVCAPLTNSTRQLLSYEQFDVLARARGTGADIRVNKRSHTLAGGVDEANPCANGCSANGNSNGYANVPEAAATPRRKSVITATTSAANGHSHAHPGPGTGAAGCTKGTKRGTFVCNIARGAIIDTPALVDALETGKIRGAALDVTDPEPLPRDHPLWSDPNVFITPHVSWVTPCYWDRLLCIMEENLNRICAGRQLLNLVNRKEQY